MSDLHRRSRSDRLERTIHALLADTPELEAAAVVSFDGLPMAAALPATMDEDRVAAMSAALLSLGERAAQGLGRGELSQVYVEADNGTVFLVSAEDEAVLVAVAAKGAKVGMMLYEVRRAAAAVAAVLRADEPAAVAAPPSAPCAEPLLSVVQPVSEPVGALHSYSPPAPASSVAPTWSSYGSSVSSAPSASSVPATSSGLGALGGSVLPAEPPRWS